MPRTTGGISTVHEFYSPTDSTFEFGTEVRRTDPENLTGKKSSVGKVRVSTPDQYSDADFNIIRTMLYETR